MDTLHSVLFYAFAAVTVAGGLVAALLEARPRALGVAAVAVGVAGLLADLDAGFAALVALVALGACAALVLQLPGTVPAAVRLDRQLGEALAGVAFLALVYAAVKGGYAAASGSTGVFNAAALGRLLFGRDALAVEALAAALLVAAIAGGRLLREPRR